MSRPTMSRLCPFMLCGVVLLWLPSIVEAASGQKATPTSGSQGQRTDSEDKLSSRIGTPLNDPTQRALCVQLNQFMSELTVARGAVAGTLDVSFRVSNPQTMALGLLVVLYDEGGAALNSTRSDPLGTIVGWEPRSLKIKLAIRFPARDIRDARVVTVGFRPQ